MLQLENISSLLSLTLHIPSPIYFLQELQLLSLLEFQQLRNLQIYKDAVLYYSTCVTKVFCDSEVASVFCCLEY